MMLRSTLVLALSALVLCGCPRDRAPVETTAGKEESWTPTAMPPAKVPKAVPLTVGEPADTSAEETMPAVKLRLLVRNKRLQALDLAEARIPGRLTAAQLAQAPGGLHLTVGEQQVSIVVGASLSDYVRFLLGTLGALDDDLRGDLKQFLPAPRFMGLKQVVGAAFQKDQSLLVLQTGQGDTLRFSYLTPLGQAPEAPYVKELEVPRRAWIEAATATLDQYFSRLEGRPAPATRTPADQRVRALVGLWHQVGWKLKLS